MNKIYINEDTKQMISEEELKEFLFEVEVEELYNYASEYYSGASNLNAQLENIKYVQIMSAKETLESLNKWGYNFRECTIDDLWNEIRGSDNLDYIRERLLLIYNMIKRDIKGGE